MVHYFYCYMGERQRGNMENFAFMPLGTSRSENEGRVNPETSEACHKFCNEVFKKEKHGLI